jgi:hypothetical protein
MSWGMVLETVFTAVLDFLAESTRRKIEVLDLEDNVEMFVEEVVCCKKKTSDSERFGLSKGGLFGGCVLGVPL